MALAEIIILTNTVFTCPLWSTIHHESLIAMYFFNAICSDVGVDDLIFSV